MLRDEPSIRLTEAGLALGVAPSTAHRLLAMLEYHDFVRNDEALRAYVAGRALTEIGLAVVQKMDIRGIARPVLERLQAESGETVQECENRKKWARIVRDWRRCLSRGWRARCRNRQSLPGRRRVRRPFPHRIRWCL
jgi:DNA-binding IclR family transcriptional regulator